MPFLIPLLLEVLKIWKLVLHLFLKNSTTHKNFRCLGSYFCTYGFNQLTYKLSSIKLYLRMGKWDRKNISPQPYIYEVVKVHLSRNVSAMPLSICSTQSSPNNIERSSIEKKLCRDCKYPSIPLDSTPSAPHDGVIEPTLNSPLFHHVHSSIHPHYAHRNSKLSWLYGDMLRRNPSVTRQC